MSSVPRHVHLPVGVPTTTATEPRVLSPTYQVDEPTTGHLQTHRLQVRVAALGPPQEQTRHELRNDGPRSPVSVCLSVCLSVSCHWRAVEWCLDL